MSLGENIHNAVVVLQNTYENIDRLIKYCQTIAERDSNYSIAIPKFLRYKSDNDWKGWMVNYFILLFQNKNDNELKNGWRDGAIFVMEINLEDEAVPKVYLSKYEYKSIQSWSVGCSPASYRVFYSPLRDKLLEHMKLAECVTVITPKPSMEQSVADAYWNVARITCIELLLVDLTVENIKDKIFGSFDKLSNL